LSCHLIIARALTVLAKAVLTAFCGTVLAVRDLVGVLLGHRLGLLHVLLWLLVVHLLLGLLLIILLLRLLVLRLGVLSGLLLVGHLLLRLVHLLLGLHRVLLRIHLVLAITRLLDVLLLHRLLILSLRLVVLSLVVVIIVPLLHLKVLPRSRSLDLFHYFCGLLNSTLVDCQSGLLEFRM